MDRPGNQAFARAAFPRDQHGQFGVHDTCDQLVQRLHRRGTPHQRQIVSAAFGTVGGRANTLSLQRLRGTFHQVRQIERFGQVVERIGLGGLNGGHDRVLRRNHDDWQFRPHRGNFRQSFEPIAVGHDDIGNHQIAAPFLDPALQRDKRTGRMHPASRARQRLGQNGANGAVVIRDKNGAVHRQSPCGVLGATGSEMRKTVRPGTVSNVIQPSWSEMILLTRASPSPVPFSRPETKGSNT